MVAGDSIRWQRDEATGLILLDRVGKLVLVNETVGAWVRTGRLRIAEGRIALASPNEQQALDTAIGVVLRGGRTSTVQVGCSAPWQRLQTVVMQARRDWHFPGQPDLGIGALIMFIADSREGVLRSYGLTQAEARVALAAADGAMNSEIARKLRVSRNTIKTHLRRVYDKMGIRRQAELVRVLAASAGSGFIAG
jgi:DNA-binding CsgD family transcriptional regulator